MAAYAQHFQFPPPGIGEFLLLRCEIGISAHLLDLLQRLLELIQFLVDHRQQAPALEVEFILFQLDFDGLDRFGQFVQVNVDTGDGVVSKN